MLTSRGRSRFLFLAGTIVALVYPSVIPVAAQRSTATILGTVADSSGAAIPEATVQARNAETGATQSTISDSQGRYRIADLAVGEYQIQSEKTGFQTVVQKGVVLTVGGQIVVDLTLPVGQVTETVTVEGTVSQVETTSSTISTVVEQVQIREL